MPSKVKLTMLFSLFGLWACSGGEPPVGLNEGALPPCPSTPNCVNSQAPENDSKHSIAPLNLPGSPEKDWPRLQSIISNLPGATMGKVTDDYLHARFRSRVFGFIDDVECQRQANGQIDIRSASRVGYSDLGVNRKRVERIRRLLNNG